MATITDLSGLLTQLAPHAGTDDTLPQLRGIHLECDGVYVYGVATDRYTVAVARRAVRLLGEDDSPRERWALFLPRESWPLVRHVADVAASAKTGLPGLLSLAPVASVPGGPERLTVTTAHHTVTVIAAPTAGYAVVEDPQPFPDWRQLLRKYLGAEVGGPFEGLLAPAYLGRWRTAQLDRGAPLTVWSARGAVLVAAGSDFVGVQVPVLRSAQPTAPRPGTVQQAWQHDLAAAPLTATGTEPEPQHQSELEAEAAGSDQVEANR
jgi:hypothetical protein